MIRKLFALVSGECIPDAPDSPMNQEILLGGHLYLAVLKEKLETFLVTLRLELEKLSKTVPNKFEGNNSTYVLHLPLLITH